MYYYYYPSLSTIYVISDDLKMTSVYVWGNHLCSNKNGFQDTLHQLIRRHTKLYNPAYHYEPKIDKDAIDRLKENLRPWPAILVIVLDSTNLKKDESILQFLEHFQNIHRTLVNYPNYQVVTCGIIPPQAPTSLQQVRLKSLDCHLQQLLELHEGTYIPLFNYFDYADYVTNYELNYRGSVKLAGAIVRVLRRLEIWNS